jgi:glycerol kinase
VNVGKKAFASKYGLYNARTKLILLGLYPLVGWRIGKEDTHLLEGTTANAGSAVDWAVSMGFLSDAKESDALASSVDDCGDVYFVPGKICYDRD